MGADRLGDLLADREHRIERAHRLLEDHADAPAADCRISRSLSVRRSLPSKPISPSTRREPGGSSPRIERPVTVLPQPLSPTMPTPLARAQREADVARRLHLARLGAEKDAEAAHVQ